MLMTAVACYREGVEFAAVHDSYWTHAGSVDHMSRLLRQQFIVLHRQPLLQSLLHRFRSDNPDVDFPPPPECGDLVLDEVERSDFFFS